MNDIHIENEKKKIPSTNPATGEITGYTELNTVEELNEAVKKGKEVQPVWGAKSFKERAGHIFQIRNFIVENADEIAEVISNDTGKTLIDALSTEVVSSAMAANYYAKNAGKFLKRKHLKAGNILLINKRSYIDRVPFGVVGIISPWNYPFAIPFHEVIMGLMGGNAVILKVATQTLEVGKLLKRVIEAGDLPKHLFTFINLPGNIAGDAFLESGINKLFFTGSVPVGKKLMAKAAETLTPVSLELGGNDAMILCNDADINKAVDGALWAGLSNTGQSCAGVERIYVEENIYEPFVTLLKDEMKKLRIGFDKNCNVEIGSLTTENQLNTVKAHIKDAIEKGGIIFSPHSLTDELKKGFFHPPVIIENTNNNMLVMTEETFGPVLAITKVKDIEEAIDKTNDSNLGLTASVWTEDRKKGKEIASRLEVGSVTINDHLMSHGLAETPWGGFKESGIGRTHSFIGLEEMTQPRVVIDDILPGRKRNMWWYPHNKSVYNGLKGVIEFLYSPNLFKRFEGKIKMIKLYLRTFIR